MKKVFTCCTLAILLSVLGTPAPASDVFKEQRWAAQIRDGLLTGEVRTLAANGREFLAIYTPVPGYKIRGGVVLLHGMGAHPDWPDVISPLRRELPESGWATLSLQLPVLPNDARPEEYLALFPEASARIDAGIKQLQQLGIKNIVIVGHSLGAAMAAHFLAEKPQGYVALRAFVGIGMSSWPGAAADAPAALAKITLPVLDLYGSQDLTGVLGSAKARARAAREANNRDYRQVKIPGADHFFRGLDSTLVKRVASWLTRTAPGVQLR
ncbi:MAG: alpha/beta fold hydrolase [Gammaproteobacteria bacterium]|nr:alpha/beta fold hydrolase [Gammaproteobacteria bacterium]